jgi:hypothetical protein
MRLTRSRCSGRSTKLARAAHHHRRLRRQRARRDPPIERLGHRAGSRSGESGTPRCAARGSGCKACRVRGFRCGRVPLRPDEPRRPPVGSKLPAGDAAWGSRHHAMGSWHRSGPRIRRTRVRVDRRRAWRNSPPRLCPRPPHRHEARGGPPSRPRRSETARCRLKTFVPTCLDCETCFYCSRFVSPRLDRADLPGLRLRACDGAPRQPESSSERCCPAARRRSGSIRTRPS